MGGVIAASAWLLELAQRDAQAGPVVTRILRCLIATQRRTAHVLDLDAHQVRSAICHSARWGRVANVPVRCTQCSAVAKLTWWVQASAVPVADARAMAASAAVAPRPWDYLYLQRCPGADIAAALAASDNPPAERANAD